MELTLEQVDIFVGELTFLNHLIDTFCEIGSPPSSTNPHGRTKSINFRLEIDLETSTSHLRLTLQYSLDGSNSTRRQGKSHASTWPTWSSRGGWITGWRQSCHQPSEELIVFARYLDLYHTPLESGERQYKWKVLLKSRFDLV